MRRRS